MAITKFSFPTTIHFGPGARKLVGPHLAERGLKRPLVVTDKGLAALPIVAELMADLAAAGPRAGALRRRLRQPDGEPGDGRRGGVPRAPRRRRRRHRRRRGARRRQDRRRDRERTAATALEYAYDHPKVRAIGADVPWFVALPTTSGTGSEVGRSSVISEDDTHIKRIIFSPNILAKAVFADPELTLGLPPAVTAATGMDALTHNVESYLSPAYHPLCDGIALEGTRIAARALATAVREPGNLQARADMMMSSMMGAIAFQKDLGAVHSCAHALGTVCDLHHGLANALMIDTVLAWNVARRAGEVRRARARRRRERRRAPASSPGCAS